MCCNLFDSSTLCVLDRNALTYSDTARVTNEVHSQMITMLRLFQLPEPCFRLNAEKLFSEAMAWHSRGLSIVSPTLFVLLFGFSNTAVTESMMPICQSKALKVEHSNPPSCSVPSGLRGTSLWALSLLSLSHSLRLSMRT